MKYLGFAVAAAALVISATTPTAHLHAQPRTATVNDTTLPLASCATRETLWLDLYQVALYLPDGTPLDPQAILRSETPKIVRLHVTYEGEVPADIPEAWQERVRAETERELQDIYSGLNTGDVVLLAHRPDEGTTVVVNGSVAKTDRSGRLVADLLGALIGDDPTSNNMKRLLTSPGAC